MSEPKIGLGDDVIEGAENIARAIRRSVRTVHNLSKRGELPGLYRLGGRLILSRSEYSRGVAERIRQGQRRVA